MSDFRAFLRGRVYFIAKGPQISRFINEAIKDGIVFFHVQRSERGLRSRVALGDFSRLRRAAKMTHTRVHITAKYGMPFILQRWWRRKGLIIGLAVIGITLSLLSQLVLSIGVSGNKNLNDSDILRQAENMGLKTWVWHRDLNLNEIAKVLQEQMPDAAWVGIERQGTHVDINIVEKKRPIIPSEAGNLVANRAGLVQEIMVIQGIPQVHEGETVRAGQVLIVKAPPLSEMEILPDPKDPSAKKPAPEKKPAAAAANLQKAKPQNLAAKGFVRGRVWYSSESSLPLKEDKVVESGRETKGWGIKIGSGVIMVTNPNSPYDKSKKEVEFHPLIPWRNWPFSVEVINVKYKELKDVHIEREVSEARQAAEKEARAKVLKKVTPGAQIVQESVKVIPGIQGIERVRVEVETYEDLAVYANP